MSKKTQSQKAEKASEKAGKSAKAAKPAKPAKPAKAPKAASVASLAPHADGAPGIDIGIAKTDRAAIADGLARFLSDAFTLYLKTHNFHWNVTGSMFNALHNMFEAQYTEQWNALDDIAERIRALGFNAPGSYAGSSRS